MRTRSLCQGIYFLGAAADSEFTLSTDNIFAKSGQRIINYFSPKYDVVLDKGYRNIRGHKAGGASGFRDDSLFTNFRCSATHSRKGIGLHSDWSMMAAPVIELCLLQAGTPYLKETGFNVRFRVGAGEDWWNIILAFDKDQRQRIANGRSLASLLLPLNHNVLELIK